MECWQPLLMVPYGVIYSFMEVRDGKNREQEAGLNLLGIMLANGIAPYTEGHQAEKTRLANPSDISIIIIIKVLFCHRAYQLQTRKEHIVSKMILQIEGHSIIL